MWTSRAGVLSIGIAAAAALAAGSVVYGMDPLRGTITSYSVTCLSRDASTGCHTLGRTLDAAVFEISRGRQHVEEITSDGRRVPLHGCTVMSRTNWRCASGDGSQELGFTDGRPWLKLDGIDSNDLAFLPRWQYLWVKSGENQGWLLHRRFLFR